MHLSDFLCASLEQCNILGLRELKKGSLISKLYLQNLAILRQNVTNFSMFVANFIFLWQNLAKFGLSNGNFRDAGTKPENIRVQWAGGGGGGGEQRHL